MLYCEIYARRSPNDVEELQTHLHEHLAAQKAMAAAPTLAYIIIEVHDGCSRRSYQWTVIEDGGDKRLQRVHSKQEISRIEQMFLPPRLQVRPPVASVGIEVSEVFSYYSATIIGRRAGRPDPGCMHPVID